MIKKLILVLVLGFLAYAGYQFYRFNGPVPAWQPEIGAAPDMAATPHVPCDHYDPLKNAYFGDLHVHSALSWDGAGRGMLASADQAYQFAKGEPLPLPPYDNEGVGLRTAQLDRPLDFAAVTDHAESIGEVYLCITPQSPRYDSQVCRNFRNEEKGGLIPGLNSPLMVIKTNIRSSELCGDNAALCREASLTAWQFLQQSAEQWYDRSSDCQFTTFHGYEHSYAPNMNRAHRNVIFRNEVVPELPISAKDEGETLELWRSLKRLCTDTDGACDVLTIPHNPNHSGGFMFPLSDPSDPLALRRERAQLSVEMEPIVEMMQIKGESECRNGLAGVIGAPDEFCDFEKYAPEKDDCDGDTGFGYALGFGCVGRNDFARYAIAAGLIEEQALGINPYRLGFIGSTDTHNSAPGNVAEWDFTGSTGMNDSSLKRRLKTPTRNPGGLVAVWAEENSRDSLFDAMRRREVFATSGPRMKVRFFASWNNFNSGTDEGASWCTQTDAIAQAYDQGVPMGGVIPAANGGSGSPYFAIQAQRDPGTPAHPGGLLQRIQVIKVTTTSDGDYQQDVYDVAGPVDSNAGVDNATCQAHGEGRDSLCAVWQDPQFNAQESAAYYVRVIENPSCRWDHWSCIELPEAQRPQACTSDILQQTTQERAWSSPIWYSPAN